jgi:hypothetical protein
VEVNQTARLKTQLDRGALDVAAQMLIEQQRLKPAIESLFGAVMTVSRPCRTKNIAMLWSPGDYQARR